MVWGIKKQYAFGGLVFSCLWDGSPSWVLLSEAKKIQPIGRDAKKGALNGPFKN
jgi:hypothetical protein